MRHCPVITGQSWDPVPITGQWTILRPHPYTWTVKNLETLFMPTVHIYLDSEKSWDCPFTRTVKNLETLSRNNRIILRHCPVPGQWKILRHRPYTWRVKNLETLPFTIPGQWKILKHCHLIPGQSSHWTVKNRETPPLYLDSEKLEKLSLYRTWTVKNLKTPSLYSTWTVKNQMSLSLYRIPGQSCVTVLYLESEKSWETVQWNKSSGFFPFTWRVKNPETLSLYLDAAGPVGVHDSVLVVETLELQLKVGSPHQCLMHLQNKKNMVYVSNYKKKLRFYPLNFL